MAPSTLTLVIGLPGVGKSTVVKLLAQKTNAIVINSDVVRRELFPEKRDYSSKETQSVIMETTNRVKEALQKGANVILDALFTKQAPRDNYKKLAEEVGSDFKLIYVIADEEVIKVRMEERKLKGDPSEAEFWYYLDRKKHFELPLGEHSVIDNSGDIGSLEEKINAYLRPEQDR